MYQTDEYYDLNAEHLEPNVPSLVSQATEASQANICENYETEPVNLFNKYQYDELNYRERILQILRNDDPDNQRTNA